ncbi:unnamed protein product, partial [Citrullus colocynthis]
MQMQIQSTFNEVVHDWYALSHGLDIRISLYTGCIINEVDEPEVDVYQCVDQVGDFKPQTLHRDDVNPTVVCDDDNLIEIVLDFDEQVEDKLEDDENKGD